MLSFTPTTKLEKELKRLQGLFVEAYKTLEGLSPDESNFLNRFALVSNTGASTRIENAVSEVIKEGKVRTKDLGGTASTMEMAKAIASRI